MTTHPKCGKSWTGTSIEHCPACCETFTGTAAGDRHRIGEFTEESPRRCRTPEEMREKGLNQDSRGFWTTGSPDSYDRKVAHMQSIRKTS